MRTSIKGLSLIKSFEGLSLKAYLCPAGVWTIGYGHTGPDVYKGQVITNAQAEALLRDDLERFERGVERACGNTHPSQLQFDAMVSLAYNIGLGNFGSSSVLRRFKAGNDSSAASAFDMWCKARVNGRLVKLNGLVRRRTAEKQLFLAGSGLGPVSVNVSAEEATVSRETRTGELVSVPEASVVPTAPKPLSRSREVIGGAVVGTGAAVDLATDLKGTVVDVKYDTQEVPFMEKYHIPEIMALAVLALSVFIIWKRFADRREGIR